MKWTIPDELLKTLNVPLSSRASYRIPLFARVFPAWKVMLLAFGADKRSPR
jgi:hypothetical protein